LAFFLFWDFRRPPSKKDGKYCRLESPTRLVGRF
jgi:hypothetical protein